MHKNCDSLERGLSPKEITSIENTFGLQFPPDIRYFLEAVLPMGRFYPNWRRFDDRLAYYLDWPRIGIKDAVRDGTYWDPTWGDRPLEVSEAVNHAMRLFESAPKLIPICNLNYVSSEPHIEGNPVLSVHQTDIIYFGRDLAHRLMYVPQRAEYRDKEYPGYSAEYRYIKFWTEMVRHNVGEQSGHEAGSSGS